MGLFYILVVTHFIADFILQGNKIAINKRFLNKYLIFHSLTCSLAFLLPLINFPIRSVVWGFLIIFLTHILIDGLRVEIGRIYKLTPKDYIFWVSLGVDQILHVSVLYFVACFLVLSI